MPAAVSTQSRPKISDEMFQALKSYICKERQRKKEEQEADEEEEKQRKERERQQKQDVMTLVETRQQIAELESKVEKLKDKKHVLFLKLKKTLTEEDNKKKQMKESSEPSDTVYRYILHEPGMSQSQMYLPMPNRNLPYKVSALSTPSLLSNSTIKRPHSPSPPPTTSYHSTYGYKPSSLQPYNPTLHTKYEDIVRRPEDTRAVLWNKNNQYPSTTYYPAPVVQSAFSYASPKTQPDSRKPLYLTNNRTQVSTSTHQAYLTNLHTVEHKDNNFSDDKYYMRQPPSNHVAHNGSIPIQQPSQTLKPGGITSGYPIRPPQSPALPTGYPASPAQVPYINVPNIQPGTLPPPF